MNNKLINLSNHPVVQWSQTQLATAQQQFGEVVDMPFPNIEPDLSSEQLDVLVDEYVKKVIETGSINVHIAGELNFVFRMVTKLKALEICCVTSTSKRIVTQQGNNKISEFNFVQFRKY